MIPQDPDEPDKSGEPLQGDMSTFKLGLKRILRGTPTRRQAVTEFPVPPPPPPPAPPPPPPPGPPPLLDDAMGDLHWWSELREFAISEYSIENIEFMEAVASYRLKQSWAKLDAIIDQYIADDAAKPVNLPAGPIRETLIAIRATPLLQRQAGDPRDDVFDLAWEEIKKLVASDTYPRFRATY